MIIWSGFGIVVPIIVLVVILVFQLAIDAALGHGYAFGHAWSLLLTFTACSAALWFTGKRMNRPSGKILVDPETGDKVQLKPRHSLFFIPVQYWAFASLAIGILMALV